MPTNFDQAISTKAEVESILADIANKKASKRAKPTSKQRKADEKAEALAMLHKFLKPGSTVYSVLRSVSKSGMSRQIDFYALTLDDKGQAFKAYLSGYIATVLDYRRADNGALKVAGCGMDMAFHVVHNMGMTMWPNGTPEPHGRRNGEPDSDGGYALKSEWI